MTALCCIGFDFVMLYRTTGLPTKNFSTEKSIRISTRLCHDRLLLTQFLLDWKIWTPAGMLRSRAL